MPTTQVSFRELIICSCYLQSVPGHSRVVGLSDFHFPWVPWSLDFPPRPLKQKVLPHVFADWFRKTHQDAVLGPPKKCFCGNPRGGSMCISMSRFLPWQTWWPILPLFALCFLVKHFMQGINDFPKRVVSSKNAEEHQVACYFLLEHLCSE